MRRLGIAVVFAALTVAATPAAAQEISLGYQWQQVSVDADDESSSDCCTAPFGINFDFCRAAHACARFRRAARLVALERRRSHPRHERGSSAGLHDLRGRDPVERERQSGRDAVPAWSARRHTYVDRVRGRRLRLRRRPDRRRDQCNQFHVPDRRRRGGADGRREPRRAIRLSPHLLRGRRREQHPLRRRRARSVSATSTSPQRRINFCTRQFDVSAA